MHSAVRIIYNELLEKRNRLLKHGAGTLYIKKRNSQRMRSIYSKFEMKEPANKLQCSMLQVVILQLYDRADSVSNLWRAFLSTRAFRLATASFTILRISPFAFLKPSSSGDS